MTLADAIINSQDGTIDRALAGSLTSVAKAIGKAERFYISRETMTACYELASSRPSSMRDVLPICRVPFQKVWFEWDMPVWGVGVDNNHMGDNTAIPKRFGALLECVDETHKRFGVSFVWSFKDGSVAMMPVKRGEELLNVSPIGILVNWADGWRVADRYDLLNGQILVGDPTRVRVPIDSPWSKFMKIDSEREAIQELNGRILTAIPPHFEKIVQQMSKNLGFQTFETLLKTSMDDISGEISMVQAVLCMLNSRNCVSLEKSADVSRLNKKRRSLGKEPLVSYSTVNIDLSKRDSRAAAADGMSRAEIRKHVVRGHFKLRKKGVYWWRPYIRGNATAGEVVRAGYNVAGVPRAA